VVSWSTKTDAENTICGVPASKTIQINNLVMLLAAHTVLIVIAVFLSIKYEPPSQSYFLTLLFPRPCCSAFPR
jgi:hypothetical protein